MKVLVCGGRGYEAGPFASASRRASSASIAARIMSSRGSPSANAASTRASISAGKGNVIRFSNSFFRPTRDVEPYV